MIVILFMYIVNHRLFIDLVLLNSLNTCKLFFVVKSVQHTAPKCEVEFVGATIRLVGWSVSNKENYFHSLWDILIKLGSNDWNDVLIILTHFSFSTIYSLQSYLPLEKRVCVTWDIKSRSTITLVLDVLQSNVFVLIWPQLILLDIRD